MKKQLETSTKRDSAAVVLMFKTSAFRNHGLSLIDHSSVANQIAGFVIDHELVDTNADYIRNIKWCVNIQNFYQM